MSIDRIEAMIKRCRRKGGDCPCADNCKAEVELKMVIRSNESLLTRQRKKLAWLTHEPCTVREGWSMPEKPEGDYFPAVYNEGDGWCPHWFSETEKDDVIDFPPGDPSWPFVEDTAYGEDWERLGFDVL